MLLSFGIKVRGLGELAKMFGFVTPREVHPVYAGLRIPIPHQPSARTPREDPESPPCNTLH
jgi:hypothetical protein